MTQTIDYILNDIKPLKIGDKIKKAQALFAKNPVSHLPVIDRNIFYGNIAKQDIEFTDYSDEFLDEIKPLIQPFYATNNMNWFEVLQY
ncbi:MAG: hypothetical protein L3J34_07695, partial [Flavobacteriaceae bacterium]|nr:hypothetical protein [Flavobacteriaceae bacterium]